jgi:SAM-dependent methyltransferase
MGLRNFLLLTSLIIIGFCLSLYIQTKDTSEQVKWEEFGPVELKDETSHSLADLNAKIAPYRLEDILQEVVERNRLAGHTTRVMELGTRGGRVLLELKKIFPEVEFYGVNKHKTHSFHRRESFVATALKFELFNLQEIKNMELPYVVFEDLDFGRSLPYNPEKFDLIFSQGMMSQIKYKFELLNEVLRLLRPGGLSFHTNVSGLKIYSKGLILDQRDAFMELRRWGIEINSLEDKTSIRMKRGENFILFPVSPHHPVPENKENLNSDKSQYEMGYNLNL